MAGAQQRSATKRTPRGRASTVGARKLRETLAGEFAGLLPFSRMTHSTADVFVEEPLEMLHLDSRLFPDLVRECPGVTAACVHAMLDRAQALMESNLHDEKMFSLGKLAAGIAHELNNPVSAVLRSSDALARQQRDLESASEALSKAQISEAEWTLLRELRDGGLSAPRSDASPIARAALEERLADWLDARGVDSAACTLLAETSLTPERLEALAQGISPRALGAAVAWIAASIGAAVLVAEIGQAGKRMHDLISSVRDFTQMDRPLAPEPTRIAPGVRDSVAILGPKARARLVTIDVDVPDALPPVRASAAELNQVWASLLDNALDAAPRSTPVTIAARTAGGSVVVSVVDRGDGIPAAIRGRIFDPFFTTKPVGQGRGLGLDTARRVIALLGGHIEFDTGPGRTEFRVTLPIDHTA